MDTGNGFARVLPELVLGGGALLLFMIEAFRPGRRLLTGILAGAALIAAGWLAWRTPDGTAYGMLSMDALSRFLKVLLAGGVLVVLGLSYDFAEFRDADPPFEWGTYLGTLLLAALGGFLLVSSRDWIMVLIGLETLSVTSFVLVGFPREDRRASEAAIKYFLTGAFATGFMIYGLSLLYGVTGSTAIEAIGGPAGAALPPLWRVGGLFFLWAGFGFKLALAPFHLWAPDVYEGAPTPVTAFLSIVPKAAVFGMVLRVFVDGAGDSIRPLLAVIAAVTMTAGNLGALRQGNVKRLLAYSSVAQMGYVMVGFVSSGAAGPRSVLVYLAAYVVMNLGAFACVTAVTEEARSEGIEAFSGLAARSLPLALVTTVFLLSLTGIPPMIGFIGKFNVFAAGLQTDGLLWLVLAAAVNSVVSFAYYFSIVRQMFFGEARRPAGLGIPVPVLGCVAAAAIGTLALGLFPNDLLRLVEAAWPR